MRAPSRVFTLSLIEDQPAAAEALRQWRSGYWTFEEALMEVVKRLWIAADARPPSASSPHGGQA